jgi:ATP-binding cassette, subfamily B, bacterial PglK
MLTMARQILALLEPRERWELLGLLALIVLMALIQAVGVASILPFMSLVANPEVVETNRWLAWLFTSLGFESMKAFLIFVGVLVLAITAFSNAFSALTNWLTVKFVWNKQYRLSVRLLTRYLNAPYSFFLTHNTSGLAKSILNEVTEAVNGLIMPAVRLFAQVVVAIFILALLFLVDAGLALIALVVLGGAYVLLYTLVRRKQARLGAVRFEANRLRFKAASEAFGGIKETKVLAREPEFLRRFSRPARRYTRAHTSHALITEIPRYGLETIAFGGILLVVLYMIQTRDDVGQAVAVASLYALAGYRLIPALQNIFSSVTKFRFYRPVLKDLLDDLRLGPDTDAEPETGQEAQALPFERDLVLEGVRFSYAESEAPAVDGVDLRIGKDTTVGFVGATGSGKTTLVDLILGLHRPQRGSIRVDGVPLARDNLGRWRRRVGYVPQHIYLCDDTVARNIAFGLPDQEIDRAAVERAARLAQLHDFIAGLPEGYGTVVGERGVRLSGGQRQRIGIARAMYHNPDVLIMDEGTSALDGITEDGVIDAIRHLSGRKTIVLVAHRVSTLRDCTAIHLFHDGRIVDSGSYAELLQRSSRFRAMAKTGHLDAVSA